jgi:hypothetical protein
VATLGSLNLSHSVWAPDAAGLESASDLVREECVVMSAWYSGGADEAEEAKREPPSAPLRGPPRARSSSVEN